MDGEALVLSPTPGASLAAPGDFTPAAIAAGRALCLEPIRRMVTIAAPGMRPQTGAVALTIAREAVMAPVYGVDFPWIVLGPIGWIFGDQLDRIFGLIGDGPLRGVAQAIAGVITDVGHFLWTALAGIGGIIAGAMTTAALMVATLFAPIITALGIVIRDALAAVGDAIRYVTGLLVTVLASVLGAVAATIGGAISGAAALVGGVIGTVAAVIGGAIAGAAALVGGGVLALGKVLVDIVLWLGKYIGEAIATLNRAIAGVAGAFWGIFANINAWIIKNGLRLIGDVSAWVRQAVIDPMLEFGKKTIEWVVGQLSGMAGGNPETAPALALSLLLASVPLGMGAHMLANIAEHSHPLKHVGYDTTARALVELTNLRTISRATIGAGYEQALGRPFAYYLARRVRPTIPRIGEAMELAAARHVSIADARLWMAYGGLSDVRLQAMLDHSWRLPSLLNMRRLADEGTLPTGWTRENLRELGYHDDNVDVLARQLEHTQYAKQRSALYSAAYGLLKGGVSTPARFAADVGVLALPADQIALAVRAAKLGHAEDLATFQATTLRSQAASGVITLADLGVGLAAIGFAPDRIAAEVGRVRGQLTGKVAVKVTAEAAAEVARVRQQQTALWIQRFRRGLVDESGLYGRLVAIGLDPDLVRTTVDIEVARLTPLVPVKADTTARDVQAKVLGQLEKLYVDEFRAGLIDDAQLRGDLLAIGLDADLVEAIVSDEIVRAYKPPDTTPAPEDEALQRAILAAVEGLYRDRYRAGMIDDRTYLAALLASGMDDLLAQVTVERERLRYAVAHPVPGVAGVAGG